MVFFVTILPFAYDKPIHSLALFERQPSKQKTPAVSPMAGCGQTHPSFSLKINDDSLATSVPRFPYPVAVEAPLPKNPQLIFLYNPIQLSSRHKVSSIKYPWCFSKIFSFEFSTTFQGWVSWGFFHKMNTMNIWRAWKKIETIMMSEYSRKNTSAT